MLCFHSWKQQWSWIPVAGNFRRRDVSCAWILFACFLQAPGWPLWGQARPDVTLALPAFLTPEDALSLNCFAAEATTHWELQGFWNQGSKQTSLSSFSAGCVVCLDPESTDFPGLEILWFWSVMVTHSDMHTWYGSHSVMNMCRWILMGSYMARAAV